MHVHVITASKHGSTGEIGEAIAERLRTRGLEALAIDARDTELPASDPVVVGSPIYIGEMAQGGTGDRPAALARAGGRPGLGLHRRPPQATRRRRRTPAPRSSSAALRLSAPATSGSSPDGSTARCSTAASTWSSRPSRRRRATIATGWRSPRSPTRSRTGWSPAGRGHLGRGHVVVTLWRAPSIAVAGGGPAALEGVLAILDVLPEASVEVIAPASEFICRPLAVREPFGAPGLEDRFPISDLVEAAGPPCARTPLPGSTPRRARSSSMGAGRIRRDPARDRAHAVEALPGDHLLRAATATPHRRSAAVRARRAPGPDCRSSSRTASNRASRCTSSPCSPPITPCGSSGPCHSPSPRPSRSRPRFRSGRPRLSSPTCSRRALDRGPFLLHRPHPLLRAPRRGACHRAAPVDRPAACRVAARRSRLHPDRRLRPCARGPRVLRRRRHHGLDIEQGGLGTQQAKAAAIAIAADLGAPVAPKAAVGASRQARSPSTQSRFMRRDLVSGRPRGRRVAVVVAGAKLFGARLAPFLAAFASKRPDLLAGPGAPVPPPVRVMIGAVSEADLWQAVLYIHLLGMAFFVGGQLFLLAVVVPAAHKAPDAFEIGAIARGFGVASAVALLILIVTGVAMASHLRALGLADVAGEAGAARRRARADGRPPTMAARARASGGDPSVLAHDRLPRR